MLVRTRSVLPRETDILVHRIIGCALAVHKALGAGYLEAVYHKAMRVELTHQGLPYRSEVVVPLTYRGESVHSHRVDLIVDAKVIVELKAVEKLERIHQSQLVSYLKATGLQAGLLMNFNTEWLRGGIRRVVL